MKQKKKSVYSTGNPAVDDQIAELVGSWGVEERDANDYAEMIMSVYKLARQEPSRGDLLLFNRALKEMRYAEKIFAPYANEKKICVFGSARTWSNAAEYKSAETFGRLMAAAGYMIITGGGDGIMGAAQAGGGRERGFGLNIQLPFEQAPNETIAGDNKLINFRYFFTRKLNFVKESHAIALYPGGFGTMDECFEALTLIQTGKANMIPIVFIDSPGGDYWESWETYIHDHLLGDGLISPSDFNLFTRTDDIEEARDYVLRFYHNFHSYRFVGDLLVLRLHRPLPAEVEKELAHDFADIILPDGRVWQSGPLKAEANQPEIDHLHRLCLDFDRMTYGRLRLLIDRVNDF
ncbi:MAG: TIGR00730 family Rossman fold protein [Verrucomicrobiota bacterium]